MKPVNPYNDMIDTMQLSISQLKCRVLVLFPETLLVLAWGVFLFIWGTRDDDLFLRMLGLGTALMAIVGLVIAADAVRVLIGGYRLLRDLEVHKLAYDRLFLIESDQPNDSSRKES